MKRLLFFTKMNLAVPANGGIRNKIFAQARAFEELGIETDVLFFENHEVKIVGSHFKSCRSTRSKLEFLKYLYFGFLSDLKIADYDYVYIRHFITNPLFLMMLRRMKRQNNKIKIYMEVPSYPYIFEFANAPFKKRIEVRMDAFNTRFFKNYIERIVTFSKQKKIFDIPTIVTDNGIDVKSYGLVDPVKFDGKNLHLLGLANVQIWHGFDRLILGIKEYYKQERDIKVHFHIVGEGAEIQNLKDIVSNNALQEQVHFHGFLGGAKLIEMFSICHLGIGSLGMHRINVAKGETSTLKSREYAARGIPFVVAYKDRGFPDNYPYLLCLDADDTPINISTLIEFYLRVSSDSNFSKSLNAYASENLTWKAKLQPVVQSYIENH